MTNLTKTEIRHFTKIKSGECILVMTEDKVSADSRFYLKFKDKEQKVSEKMYDKLSSILDKVSYGDKSAELIKTYNVKLLKNERFNFCC